MTQRRDIRYSDHLIKQLAEVLGFDAGGVSRVVIDLRAGEIGTIEVTSLTNEELEKGVGWAGLEIKEED
jgi:hypothetical protein